MDKLIAINKQRFYEIDFNDVYENTAPYELRINDFVLTSNAWGTLASDLTKYLLDITGKNYNDIAPFRVSWSDKIIYQRIKSTNYKEVIPNQLYVCTNWNGTQGAWMIKEILEFFNVNMNSVTMIIKRFPISEKEEDREFYKSRMKREYIDYLVSIKGMKVLDATKKAKNIDLISKTLKDDVLKSFVDLYLVDDHARLTSLISNIRIYAKKKYTEEQALKISNQVGDYAKFVKYRINY